MSIPVISPHDLAINQFQRTKDCKHQPDDRGHYPPDKTEGKLHASSPLCEYKNLDFDFIGKYRNSGCLHDRVLRKLLDVIRRREAEEHDTVAQEEQAKITHSVPKTATHDGFDTRHRMNVDYFRQLRNHR
jgi:hypothetical protein